MSLILDQSASISHLTKDIDNNDKESYKVDLGLRAVAINIQPAAPEDTILSDGTFAQTWIGFTTQSGVRTGDLLTVLGTLDRKFVVKGIEFWDMLDLPHYELTLTEFVENEIS